MSPLGFDPPMNTRTVDRSFPGPLRRRRAGFSLIEVLIAGAVVAIAVVGAVGSIASTAKLGRANEETTRAYQAGRQMVEQLMAVQMNQALALYNESGADDPGGAGTAPGPSFAVFGLDARPEDRDGQVGRLLFPTDPADPAVLREDLVEASFGMPRDLTGDDAIDGVDHSHDYFVLPVRVRLEWRGVSGNRTLEIDTLLAAR